MRSKMPNRHWRVLAQRRGCKPPITLGWSVDEESARIAVKMLNALLSDDAGLLDDPTLVWCEEWNTTSAIDHERWTLAQIPPDVAGLGLPEPARLGPAGGDS